MQQTGGAVTANAGTNLNTSALALESGGNLAALVAAAANPTPAGTNIIGKVGIDQTTPGTTNAVTANAGTNLNTSALALETGGNLAAIKTNTALAAAATSAGAAAPVQGVTGGVPLRVSGTFFQATQPVSAASLPLPTGAATSANQAPAAAQGSTTSGQTGPLVQAAATFRPPSYLAATTNPLSSDQAGQLRVSRGTAEMNIGVTTTAGAYTAGQEVGELISFANAVPAGVLQSICVTSKSVVTGSLKAYLFATNPNSSTWADKTTPAINAADLSKLLGYVTLNAPDSGLGTSTIWSAGNVGFGITQTTFFIVLVAVAAITLGSTSDINVHLTVEY
ncbi:MAG: hypothetical protein ACREDD_09000 [Methylocella sp.]